MHHQCMCQCISSHFPSSRALPVYHSSTLQLHSRTCLTQRHAVPAPPSLLTPKSLTTPSPRSPSSSTAGSRVVTEPSAPPASTRTHASKPTVRSARFLLSPALSQPQVSDYHPPTPLPHPKMHRLTPLRRPSTPTRHPHTPPSPSRNTSAQRHPPLQKTPMIQSTTSPRPTPSPPSRSPTTCPCPSSALTTTSSPTAS